MQQNLKLSRFILLLYISLCATELSVQRACASALCKNWLSLKNEGEMEEAEAKLVPLLSRRCYSCEVMFHQRKVCRMFDGNGTFFARVTRAPGHFNIITHGTL